ncbi:MAG: argininosuccinate lyase [Anaerovoracaceae bacterium]|jgi:argininosuccinate lyase
MKLWKGRFSRETCESADRFGASIDVDKRLYEQDIKGSIAHAKMLSKQGIISREDADLICHHLLEIKNDIENGKVSLSADLEDIHMNIESILTDRIGDVGRRLHTGRSRNDQIATDLRLYQKERIDEIIHLLRQLKRSLKELASRNLHTIMPGYTHLQHAQPISLAFHLMAYHEMFQRDEDRFSDCFKRTDCLPLGSGALAGTSFDTDRNYLSSQLNFSQLCKNAMDGVSDRDFAIEFVSCCAITMMHLSRFCEELIIWNSQEFGFVEMDDAYSTGSSIMPQKKNPDMAELIRGKTGRVYGDLTALLTVMKSLPLAYNKDMQEDKPPLFDAGDTLIDCLNIFARLMDTIKFNKDVMKKSAKMGFMNATDCADYLVRKGLPFRKAHEIIGSLVLYCIEKEKILEDLTLTEFKNFSHYFEEDIFENISPEACVASKRSSGGTSPDRVEEMLY